MTKDRNHYELWNALFDKAKEYANNRLGDKWDRLNIMNVNHYHNYTMQYLVDNFCPPHPVMQEGKFVQWAEDRLPVDDEQPEPIKPNSLAGLNEAIKNHPNGGSYVVISDNPLHKPLRFAWCQSITARSNPSQDLDTHSSNC